MTVTEPKAVPAGDLVIAIDGPSGTGKSTVARAVAKELGATYLDTGAMYRVATLAVLRAGVDPADHRGVIAVTAVLPLVVNEDPDSTEVILGGEDVSGEIRSQEVTAQVSAVAAIPQVRENLVALQRRLAHGQHRCVVEGRDIGTVVLPDAPTKVFMTAAPAVRAQRRVDQDRAAGREADYEAILAAVIARDEADSSRAVAPLRPAADATIIDTSQMSITEVIDTIISQATAPNAGGSLATKE